MSLNLIIGRKTTTGNSDLVHVCYISFNAADQGAESSLLSNIWYAIIVKIPVKLNNFYLNRNK